MRKLGFACAAAGIVAVLGLSTAYADPPQDFVTGGGISAVETRFGFTAHSSPTGANPRGHATFTNAGTQRKGAVTCLNVVGNAATFGIEDRNEQGERVFRLFFVRDNGEPSGGVPDELREVTGLAGSPVPLPCPDPSGLNGLPLQAGNIQVYDAS